MFAGLATARDLQNSTGVSIKTITTDPAADPIDHRAHRSPRAPRRRPDHPSSRGDPDTTTGQPSLTHLGDTSQGTQKSKILTLTESASGR